MSPSLFKHYKTGTIYIHLGLIKRESDWDDLVLYAEWRPLGTERRQDPSVPSASRPASEFYGFVGGDQNNTCASDHPLARRRYAPYMEHR